MFGIATRQRAEEGSEPEPPSLGEESRSEKDGTARFLPQFVRDRLRIPRNDMYEEFFTNPPASGSIALS